MKTNNIDTVKKFYARRYIPLMSAVSIVSIFIILFMLPNNGILFIASIIMLVVTIWQYNVVHLEISNDTLVIRPLGLLLSPHFIHIDEIQHIEFKKKKIRIDYLNAENKKKKVYIELAQMQDSTKDTVLPMMKAIETKIQIGS